MPHDNCKIADKLVEIHTFAHRCLENFSHDDLVETHDLGNKILDLLNNENSCNGVKFLALFEAIAVGADRLESEGRSVNSWVN